MPVERSAGGVVFVKEKAGVRFLLLSADHGQTWGFPKGHIEKGESVEEAALREIKEETGLNRLKMIPDFKKWTKYFFKKENQIVFKIVTFFLVRSFSKKVRLSKEHTDYQWLPEEKAIKTLTFKNDKAVLIEAVRFLKENYEHQKGSSSSKKV